MNIDMLKPLQIPAQDGRASLLSKLKDAEKANPKETDKLKDACRQFEAVLVSQMMKEMRATLPKNDFFGSDDKEDFFRGMLDDEISKDVAQSRSLGLAEIIYSQLAPRNTAKVPSEAVDISEGKTENTSDPLTRKE
jgi:Rod binding domain-containing protein